MDYVQRQRDLMNQGYMRNSLVTAVPLYYRKSFLSFTSGSFLHTLYLTSYKDTSVISDQFSVHFHIFNVSGTLGRIIFIHLLRVTVPAALYVMRPVTSVLAYLST